MSTDAPATPRATAVAIFALSPCGRGQLRNFSIHSWVRGTPHPAILIATPSSPLPQGERAHRRRLSARRGRNEHRRGRDHRLRRPVRADALARAGRHGDGPRRRVRLCLSHLRRSGAEDRRAHHDAHGHRLQLRGDPAVPADGRVRHHLGHEPRAVPRRQCLPRPSARRARHCHHRGLRRLRGDLRLLGRDRRDLLQGGVSRDAALRLSAVVRDRRDRGRWHARHHDPALHCVRDLRPDHRAGRRQAVHRGHPARHPRRSRCT